MPDEIPSRELRNQVSAVLRRVEETGEPLTVTVSGRPVARLVPLPSRPDTIPWPVFREALGRMAADPGLAEDLAGALPDTTDDLP